MSDDKTTNTAEDRRSELTDLLCCPFCGNDYPHTVKELDVNLKEIYQIYCDECGCSLPFEPDIEIARSRWNERSI